MAEETDPSRQRRTIITLPAEIRTKILGFVVEDYGPEIRIISWKPWKTQVIFKTNYKIRRQRGRHVIKNDWDVMGPILMSRELRDDFFVALGESATFTVHPAMLQLLNTTGTTFIDKITPAYASRIEFMQMQLNLTGPDLPDRSGLCLSKCFPALHEIKVTGRYPFRSIDVPFSLRPHTFDAYALTTSDLMFNFAHRQHDRVLKALCGCPNRKFKLSMDFAVGSFTAYIQILQPKETFVDYLRKPILQVAIKEKADHEKDIKIVVDDKYLEAVELRDSGRAHSTEWMF